MLCRYSYITEEVWSFLTAMKYYIWEQHTFCMKLHLLFSLVSGYQTQSQGGAGSYGGQSGGYGGGKSLT